jgi:hypothetical protein
MENFNTFNIFPKETCNTSILDEIYRLNSFLTLFFTFDVRKAKIQDGRRL